MAWRVIGSRAARSVAVAGPPTASAARIPRRLGSASAVNTSAATASLGSGSLEVGNQLSEFVVPAFVVATEGLGVLLAVRLSETTLYHGQPCSGVRRFEGELDVRAARVAGGQPVQAPREAEDARLLDPLDPQRRLVAARPRHPHGAARPQVDRRLMAEPTGQPFGGGDCRPHPRRWLTDV